MKRIIAMREDEDDVISTDESYEAENAAEDSSNDHKTENMKVSEKTVRYSRKIEPNMTDAERYEVLKKRSINNIPLVTELSNSVLEKIPEVSSWEDINKYLGKDKRNLIQKLTEEFRVFDKEYFNDDIELSFEFSGNNFRESYNKQGHNYVEFAKMFSTFDSVIESAVGVEIHNRTNYKPDPTLDNVFVLMSAYQDGDFVVPVKLEVKKFKDKQNTLYVAISLDKIKRTEVWKQGNTKNGVTQNSRSVNISIAKIFEKINPSDKSFVKYIPDGFLNEAQKEAKRQALDAEGKAGETKYSRKADQETSTLDTYAYSGTVKSSSKKNGKFVELKAQVLNEKVYKRNDVSEAISGIRLFNLLSKQDRTQLVEDTWIALNKAKNSDDRIKAVRDILSKAINYSVTELSSKQTLVESGASVESLAGDAIINFVKLLNKGQESYKAAVDRRANKYIKEEDAKLKARKTELKANYESDKVYTKAEISKMVESLSGLASIPKRFRTEIVNDIWTAFNSRYSPGQREQHASLLADKIFVRVMQESGDTFDNTSQEDLYAMERDIHKALKKIAREGGSPSTRSKLEAEFNTSEAGYWKKQRDEAVKTASFFSKKLIEKMHIKLSKI